LKSHLIKKSSFNPLVSDSRRRRLGRYDTPRPLSQAIADWAVRAIDDVALEPSSGAGVFVQSFAHRLIQLGRTQPNRQLWACDIDVKACEQTEHNCNLSSRHIWNEDFLSIVNTDGINGMKFNCVAGNPPYISLHRMPLAQRQRALKAVERLKLSVGGRASLWAYFLETSIHVLKIDGRAAFILPESVLHAEYALSTVRSFAKFFQRCALVSIRERCFISDGAEERVVVVLADGFDSVEKSTDITLHECITAAEAVRVIGTIQQKTKNVLPVLNGHAVPHLLPKMDSLVDISNVPNSHLFNDFADVKIGVVTGADHFFLLTEKEKRQWKIRRSWLTPLLPRFQECSGLTFCKADWTKIQKEGKKCWLISPSLLEKKKSSALRLYFRRFPIKLRKKNKTFFKRKLWFAPVKGKKQHAFFRYMGATGPRIAFSRFHSTCTNIIHRIYFKRGISPLVRKAIILSLHSSFSQLSAEFEGRAYGSGVLKLEPSETRRLKFLLPPQLNRENVDEYFEMADAQLKQGNVDAAVTIIDDWLYSHVPALEQSLPRQALHALLKMTVQRRLGYPKHFTNAVTRKNDSKDYASHAASNQRNNQNVVLESSVPQPSRRTTTSDLIPNC
jgi:adenine-specific DNA-methyltransferase